MCSWDQWIFNAAMIWAIVMMTVIMWVFLRDAPALQRLRAASDFPPEPPQKRIVSDS